MNSPGFLDSAPQSEQITAYDKDHFVTYLRLLDAAAEGADWREIAQIVFEIDPASEPVRAKTIHDTHLARARWMARKGYTQIASRE